MEVLIEYKPEILVVASFIYIPFIAFIISLGMVYLFGRMLEILKNYRSKNAFAVIVMLAVYAFYFLKYNPAFSLEQKIWYAIIYTAISVILYVLVGFKLYDRVDALLDKKIGADLKEKTFTKSKVKK
jgi:hypothetical protein